MRKNLKFFLFFIFIFAISKELLVFSEEYILLIAGFIMFNIFLKIGWSILENLLMQRTDEIFYIFYELFDLTLENLKLYKNLQEKKLEIKVEINNILKIIKMNLIYFNLNEIILMFRFKNYLLFSLLETILSEELNLIKVFFLQKKILLIKKKNIDYKIDNSLKILKFYQFYRYIYNKNLNNFYYNIYLYIWISQYLMFNNNLNIDNRVYYILSLLKFYINFFFEKKFYINFNLFLFYHLNLKYYSLDTHKINFYINT